MMHTDNEGWITHDGIRMRVDRFQPLQIQHGTRVSCKFACQMDWYGTSFQYRLLVPKHELEAAQERIAELEGENQRLREALEPFSGLLKKHHDKLPDNQPIFGIEGSNFTVGDLRLARKALEASR